MACKQFSVALISASLAAELGVTFRDDNNNYIIGLQLAAQLDPDEFTVIAGDYTESALKGVLPTNPSKPIVRPRP